MTITVDTPNDGIIEMDTIEQTVRWKRAPTEPITGGEFGRALVELMRKMPDEPLVPPYGQDPTDLDPIA